MSTITWLDDDLVEVSERQKTIYNTSELRDRINDLNDAIAAAPSKAKPDAETLEYWNTIMQNQYGLSDMQAELTSLQTLLAELEAML